MCIRDSTNTTIPTNGFTSNNTSSAWQISDIRVVGDVVTLDSELQNSYAEYVLSGKALNISYNTYITMLQQTAVTTRNNNMAVNISRAVSKLKTLYFSFDNATPNLATSTSNKDSIIKDFNIFVHPMAGTCNWQDEIEYTVQIGSKIMPEYPVRSLAQALN